MGLRRIGFWVAVLVATGILGTAAVAAGFLDRKRSWVRHVAPLWSRILLWAGGVRVQVDRRPAAPAGSAPVFVSNHQSNLDVPVLSALLPHRVLWLAKKELFSIPVFGQAMRAVGYLPVDRGDRDAARRSIEAAAGQVREGAPVILFPEGTRSPDGRLLPFKPGFVHLALASGAPVVPVVIRGTAELWPKGSPWLGPGEVSVRFLEAVHLTPEDAGDPRAAAERVRRAMAEAGAGSA